MTTQTTCPSWCTELDRDHGDSPLAHAGPGYEVRSGHGDIVETWAATDDYGAPVVGMFASTSVELTVAQAQQLVAQLQAAIRWCADPTPEVSTTEGTDKGTQPVSTLVVGSAELRFGIHLDGCTLDRPFRIRPEGGREYLGGDR